MEHNDCKDVKNNFNMKNCKATCPENMTISEEKVTNKGFLYDNLTTPTQQAYFRHLLWTHRHATFVYCAVFCSFGMCIAFLGPTLWDLACQTSTPISTMTWVFFVQSLFIMLGSLSGGQLLYFFYASRLNLFCMAMVCLTLAIIPTCGTIYSLATILAIMGFHLGIIDTTVNVSIINLYQKHVAPFAATLHFCYGFGAFLSPIIAEPFLKNFDCTQLIDNSTSNTSWIEQSFLSAQWEEIVHNQPTNMADVQEQLKVHIAFQIMSALQVPVILLLISLVFKEKFTPKSTDEAFFTTDYQNISPDSEVTELLDSTSLNGKTVIAMAGLILFFADGLQSAYVTKCNSSKCKSFFLKVREGLKKTNCEYKVAKQTSYNIGKQFGTTLAMLFLATFGHNRAALYFGTSLAGIFISSTYPMVISVVEQRINHVSQTAISFIVVAAAIGETLYPVLVGHLFDTYGWSVFLIFGSVTCAGMIVASLVLRQLAFKRRKADHSDQRSSSVASFTSGDNQWKLPLLEATKRPSKVYQTATANEHEQQHANNKQN
ncbi:Major facilitator superfamily domain-containing protein 4-B [Trichinella pseudospiralis]|uniref:Major facilitator superfamily domain-containing protein 4A n=1 Tax=Trichinella pseudospiralis TaxID=6337 RepID=A0A0V1FSB0_TRIPS|nr:Major facilitator superfamily domain-containing protein 4-B [Trichinella pseudospiralis]KRY88887.1 Major facilitator superfamily domain-containing protein 4-B [Trichinella pseudospiralis]